jgi:hypothetical protein
MYFVFVGAYITKYQPTEQAPMIMQVRPEVQELPEPAQSTSAQEDWGRIIGGIMDFFNGVYQALVAGWQYIASAFTYIATIFTFIGQILTFDIPVPPELNPVMAFIRPIVSISVIIPTSLILFTIIKEIVNLIKPFGGG